MNKGRRRCEQGRYCHWHTRYRFCAVERPPHLLAAVNLHHDQVVYTEELDLLPHEATECASLLHRSRPDGHAPLLEAEEFLRDAPSRSDQPKMPALTLGVAGRDSHPDAVAEAAEGRWRRDLVGRGVRGTVGELAGEVRGVVLRGGQRESLLRYERPRDDELSVRDDRLASSRHECLHERVGVDVVRLGILGHAGDSDHGTGHGRLVRGQ